MKTTCNSHNFSRQSRQCLSIISLSALLIVVLSDTSLSRAIRATATSSTAQQLRANGRIAFTSERDGNREIYLMNNDGTNQVRITNNPGFDDFPDWSPDGTRLAFLSQSSGGYVIKLMNADGTGQTELTPVLIVDPFGRPNWGMDWSPDGTKIAFTNGDEIFAINIDGTNPVNLTNAPSFDSHPTWSPDGSRIMFTSDRINGQFAFRLFTMNSDGSNQTALPGGSNGNYTGDEDPAWSPDGTHLAGVQNWLLDVSVLFIRNISGTWQFLDWTIDRDSSSPTWSPDGSKIAFGGFVNPYVQYTNSEIFVINADGSGITQLTNAPGYEGHPAWQPIEPGPNPIDVGDFFIRQQYLDFLGREAEPAGLQFYMDILNGCHPADTECVKYTRGALSANFFRSPEFGRKGAYVANLFNIVMGQRPKTVAELNDPTKVERPHYAEFLADLATLSTPNDDAVLTDQKKDQLAGEWLARTEVQAILPGSLSNQQFVQKLESIAGVTLANESTLIANLNNGSQTRAQVLRAIAESNEVVTKFYIPNFVTMEYLGFLRRDPEDCHVSSDPESCGFIFHNRRFNTPGADPDLIENFIVRGFIESPEYRRRFGP